MLPMSSRPNGRRCPKCQGKTTLKRLISQGIEFNAGTRVEYPRYDFQLPMTDNTPGKPNVLSKSHEDRICKERGYRMNQGMSSDFTGASQPA